MSAQFFDHPILNSPYAYPERHWELDAAGQPTQNIIDRRRAVAFVTPIPSTKKQKGSKQGRFGLSTDGKDLSSEHQGYEQNAIINGLRQRIDAWRQLPNPRDWGVTPETARLLQHWRHHQFTGIRPFFCQVEAVETAIWLTEVAPNVAYGRQFLNHLEQANANANPGLSRLALKLATGAGKTTVMAMLIAWQTVNAVRHPNSRRFTRGFLVVTPGITIRDRLQVLQPHDPNSYYASRELVPPEMLPDIKRANIVITNFHAFKLRERMELSRGNRALLEGRHGSPIQTLETEGQMLQRVMTELMAMKNVMVLNDEAHHCYREKPGDPEEAITSDEKQEAAQNREAARLWINGLEAVNRKLGLARIFDLSATPFFLRGSGYAEGTLFPWTMSDFSLMDAIECGIVKLPRVPVADNDASRADMPRYRNLWENIRTDMPKKGRGKSAAKELDPRTLPTLLQTALDALYGHYEKVHAAWQQEGIRVPPCFIVVCNNTATSKLVYDYISGFEHTTGDGSPVLIPAALKLFSNYDDSGNPLARPRTLLIDSEQLEAEGALDDNFRKAAAPQIERFRRERVERGMSAEDAARMPDADLLREVMNTVGKEGQLGESIRCVVSVSMLTEGWDANTVTHVLGVRAFGTQLLCEQVIGRALRRQSYDLNAEGLFDVEYADILGVPFDFTAEPAVVKATKPRETIQVKAMRPERDALEIRFPRVAGYRVDPPRGHIEATFTAESTLPLTPELTGPTEVRNAGIIGETADLNVAHLGDTRRSALAYHLTKRLMDTNWRDADGALKGQLFMDLKRVVNRWLDEYLICTGGTYPAQLAYLELADMACEKINAAITTAYLDERPVRAILDAYNPVGSTMHVNFTTSQTRRWQTDSRKCHINWAILDSEWEGEFCRVVESHPRVRAYVKNHGLGFEVPYRWGSEARIYRPDYIVLVDDGRGPGDLLRLIVEIKGYRGEDAKAKKLTMDTYWVPGVNNLGSHGRWAFAEFTDAYAIQSGFEAEIEAAVKSIIDSAAQRGSTDV